MKTFKQFLEHSTTFDKKSRSKVEKRVNELLNGSSSRFEQMFTYAGPKLFYTVSIVFKPHDILPEDAYLVILKKVVAEVMPFMELKESGIKHSKIKSTRRAYCMFQDRNLHEDV